MTQDKHLHQTNLVADWKALERIFIKPEESSRKTLVKYMEQIFFGLHDFLDKNVGITEEIDLKVLSESYSDTHINKNPEKRLSDVITSLVKEIAPRAVNIASPYFIGHMTSAIPFFMVHLKSIVVALNQNVVKLETSKVVSIVERQVLAKVHRLVFKEFESFYKEHVHSATTTLGAFTEGGTTANLTALWVARNKVFAPKQGFKGVEKDGVASAYAQYNVKRSVVLVSKRGHYSLRKAGGVLGIGNKNVLALDVDKDNKLDLDCLRAKIKEFDKNSGVKIIAIVGIAGTTETGTVDPLVKIAEICAQNSIHFHVDAAWGGPVIVSEKYKHLLHGIDLADSVTIDGHKQFYMPMSCGMVFFKNPKAMDAVAYHANYVNRQGSVDLGIKSFAGSREANSLVLDSALKIMGTKGYALLIDHGIEMAKYFADEINSRDNFELITKPELNILTYRLVPKKYREKLNSGTFDEKNAVNKKLNSINQTVQRIQREHGKSFVSRTMLKSLKSQNECLVVFRCAIMNPMTDLKVLMEILDEQEQIFRESIMLQPVESSFRQS
ncbi:MAG: pyridoxal-dependent decarboxylase [Desulfobacteraceae bacterium 4572_19]|nr:MAG: pyridoxal-dependent decarboxylase [Desulfobacteraceae bacterium 4572_19]